MCVCFSVHFFRLNTWLTFCCLPHKIDWSFSLSSTLLMFKTVWEHSFCVTLRCMYCMLSRHILHRHHRVCPLQSFSQEKDQFKCWFTNGKRWKTALCFRVHSLRNDAVPPPPRPLHLPLPADVIPGRGHVLHGPPAPAASVRGAGGRSGCLPAAHETASVGLLDMADHAVTQSDHRGRNGASLMFFFCLFVFFYQTPLFS